MAVLVVDLGLCPLLVEELDGVAEDDEEGEQQGKNKEDKASCQEYSYKKENEATGYTGGSKTVGREVHGACLSVAGVLVVWCEKGSLLL